MPEVTVSEERLEELVDKAVQKHLKLTFEDMDEVRRSPGAAIVRVETRLDAVEKNMATKTDIAELRTEITELEAKQNGRFGEIGERIGRLEANHKFLIALMLSMFGAVIAGFVKLIFFP